MAAPPDNGKSVLTYHLSQALRRRGVQHYVLRAAPDGEGDWTSEADQELVRIILAPGKWKPDFVEYICRSLEQRHLPLLVDVGGRPTPWQEAIFDHCTHAILLTSNEADRTTWQALINRHNLPLLADLRSSLHGSHEVTATSPILTGIIARLQRGQMLAGPTFEAVVERIAALFAYDPDELRHHHLTSAPTETTVDLDRLARSFDVPCDGHNLTWQPRHLRDLLAYLPQGQPLGLYGRGPNWLYATAALQAYPAPFCQFDVRLGWVKPADVKPGLTWNEDILQVKQEVNARYVHFNFVIANKSHLNYEQVQGLAIPPLPSGRGLVLSGKLPHWLITALAIAYREAPWLAIYQPQKEIRVVVHSRVANLVPGDLIE